MKKHLFFAVALIGVVAMAQETGNVGIQTSTPTETLQVDGTVRITDLPKNKEGKIYTDGRGERSARKDQTFRASKTVVVDANGVLGIVDGIPKIRKTPIETQPFAPQRKCTKGSFDTATKNSKELEFENYAFKTVQSNGISKWIDVYMKFKGPNSADNYNPVRVFKMSGDGGDEGKVDLSSKDNEGWKKISNGITIDNKFQNGSVIVPNSSATFNYFVRTISGNPAVYSFCVEQMVF